MKDIMTPDQCKEHIDELLEMQVEEAELGRKALKAQEAFKSAKAAHDLKQEEIMKHLSELNQELPLFDQPDDCPFPFPLPEGVHDATLANVAADPTVLGLSIGIVKSVRDAIGASTLGAVEKFLGADKPLKVEQSNKAKKELGKKLGATQTVKLLRAIASFTTGRKAKSGKAEAKPVALPANEPAKAVTGKPVSTLGNFRETFVADLDGIGPKFANMLGQLDLATVGQVLDRLEKTIREAPENPPKTYQASSLASYIGCLRDDAQKIIDVVFEFEAKHIQGDLPEPAKPEKVGGFKAPKKGAA